MLNKIIIFTIFAILFLIGFTSTIMAYWGDTHDYITNESQKIWTSIPQEMKDIESSI